MVELEVQIEGNNRMFRNELTLEAVVAMHQLKAKKKVRDQTWKDNLDANWKNTCMFTPGTGFYIPDRYIEANLKDAGIQTSAGRGNMKKAALAGIIVLDNKIPIELPKGMSIKSYEDIEKAGLVDARVARTSTKQPIVARRVLLPAGWKAKFKVSVNEDIMEIDTVKKLFEKGGEIGLGDWRPKFGTFDIVSIKRA